MFLLFFVVTLASYFAVIAGYEKLDALVFARRNRKSQLKALGKYFPVGA